MAYTVLVCPCSIYRNSVDLSVFLYPKTSFSVLHDQSSWFFLAAFSNVFVCVCQVSQMKPRLKKVRALVDCRAVSSDQLAFFKDEVIIVTATDDPHWWVSSTSCLMAARSLSATATSLARGRQLYIATKSTVGWDFSSIASWALSSERAKIVGGACEVESMFFFLH